MHFIQYSPLSLGRQPLIPKDTWTVFNYFSSCLARNISCATVPEENKVTLLFSQICFPLCDQRIRDSSSPAYGLAFLFSQNFPVSYTLVHYIPYPDVTSDTHLQNYDINLPTTCSFDPFGFKKGPFDPFGYQLVRWSLPQPSELGRFGRDKNTKFFRIILNNHLLNKVYRLQDNAASHNSDKAFSLAYLLLNRRIKFLYDNEDDQGNLEASEIKSLAKAYQLLKECHTYDHPWAPFFLGVCLQYGQGVKANQQKALHMYETATHKGTVGLALCFCGDYYETGRAGGVPNLEKAMDFYQKALQWAHELPPNVYGAEPVSPEIKRGVKKFCTEALNRLMNSECSPRKSIIVYKLDR